MTEFIQEIAVHNDHTLSVYIVTKQYSVIKKAFVLICVGWA